MMTTEPDPSARSFGRRKRSACAAAALFVVVMFGCGSDPKPSAAAPTVVTGSVDAGTPDPLSEKLRHCPLTVDGATAELSDIDNGVELVIHVRTEEARQELAKRARHLEAFTKSKGQNTGVPHGGGQGGGWMRDCPVVTKDTVVEVSDTSDGSRLRVTAAAPAEVDSLRAETRRRLAALAARYAPSR